MGNLDTENESPELQGMDTIGSNTAISIEDVDSKSKSSGSSPGSSSSSSLGRKKWIVNGNNKVAPKDQFPGIYKAKEFDTHTDFDDDEEETDENENHPDFKPVPFFSLFRFSSAQDKLLIALAVLAAICGGSTLPVMIVLFGDLAKTFVTNGIDTTEFCQSNATLSCCQNNTVNLFLDGCDIDPFDISGYINVDNIDFFEKITEFGLGTSIIGMINLVMAYIFVTCLNHAAECQVHKIRGLFFKAILRQDIGWYDTHQTGDFAAKMAEDLNKLQEGIGEKIGMFIFFVTIFTASLVNAFYHGWELTLVILAAMPVLMIATAIIAGAQTGLTENEMTAYGKAGSIAEEVLSSIRTVVAFGGQEKEVERYEKKLTKARKAGMLRGILTGVGGGLMWFIIYSSYALAFWYGVKLIMDDRAYCIEDIKQCHIRYDPSSLLIVFFSVLMGAMNVGQAMPYVEAFSMAKASAATIFSIIERQPSIDSLSEEGLKPVEKNSNDITFSNVYFTYPARPNVSILNGLSLKIQKGETVALVGSSGCGKSTCIQMMQRFYDPDQGQIFLGQHDLKDLNVGWLRDRIGIVGQEPVLFGCSIADNIRYGHDGVTDEEIKKACKAANAYDFIAKLPNQFETMVGERGAQLSGGQKQRLAIARALVRNPEILLLDEATSALDTQSEAVVQAALDKARTGRTTVIVAHRLSTIRSADKIVALKDGQVIEIGTHDELMAKEGLYYSLVMAQISKDQEDEEQLEKDDIIEDLEVVEQALPSLTSLTNWGEIPSKQQLQRRRGSKSIIERKISVSSIVSDDSFTIEESSQVMGFAVGLSRLNSLELTRESRRERTITRQNSITPDPEDEDLPKVSTLRIIKTNAQEWPYIIMGGLASIVMGASMPVYAILFGEVLGILSKSIPEAREESVFYSAMFLVVGVVVGLAMFFQVAMFTVAGEHLTLRMRKMAFAAMLKQEMGWFDQPNNNTGALCSRLSADAAAIQGATGNRAGAILQSIFTIVLAVGAGIYHEWRLGLVGACYVPLLLVSSTFQAKIIASHDNLEKEALASSSKLAIEAITNIRTVAGLGREKMFVKRYIQELDHPHVQAKRKSHLRGLVFGFAQSMPFFAYAGCMYYGGYLVDQKELEYQNVFKVAEALILGTMMVGQCTAFAPNYNKAVLAAARVFRLLDRKPVIDAQDNSGLRLKRLDGDVNWKKATFRYPTRPQIRVLRDLDLSLKAGQNVALVGPSGCGKSTCVQLLQRFYDLKSGELSLDGHNIEGLSVPFIRSQLGIVSQEPILFDRTIAENIMYGDNERIVPMDEVIEAAKQANIHSFIASLPQGYDTRVGEKGTQLSGGQKQRVAIARALVRNPTVLLLDEATSALDTESEKVVQEALDKAQEGRTCITIAHRLSTVQNMDIIFVISHGRVTESGTHAQLLAQKGLYAKLWAKQMGHSAPSATRR